MKIKLSIYNEDGYGRDIQVVALLVGKEPIRTIIEPETETTSGGVNNFATFEILDGDMLIVTVPGI